MNTTIKKWEDRTDDTTPGAMIVAMESEIYDIRAALAAREGQQEPVAEWVNWEQGFQHLRAEGLPVGTKLYAAPVAQQSEAGALVEALRNIRDYRTDVSAEIAARSMRFYAELALSEAGAPTAAAKNCGTFACSAAQKDGIVCAEGECDIESGMRAAPTSGREG